MLGVPSSKRAAVWVHSAGRAYAGAPELVAYQLGHTNTVMVLKVYGKYRPSVQDLA